MLRAIHHDLQWLGYAASFYSSIGRGLDYRSPLSWVTSDVREEVETAVDLMSSAAEVVMTGCQELRQQSNNDDVPPWSVVVPGKRRVELALYSLALAHSRLVFALRARLREAEGVAPLPVLEPAEPVRLKAGQSARDAQIALGEERLAAFAAMPKPEHTPAAPWPQALAALGAGAEEVEAALSAALEDPLMLEPARRLGLRWADYADIVKRLPLRQLTPAGRAEVEERAGFVADLAREVASAPPE